MSKLLKVIEIIPQKIEKRKIHRNSTKDKKKALVFLFNISTV